MKKILVILASAAALFSASSCGKQLEVTPPNAIYDEQIQDILQGTDESKKQLVLQGIAAPMVKYFNLWNIQSGSTGALAPMTYCYQGIEQARSLQGNDMVFGLNKNNVNDLAGTSYYEGTADYRAGDGAANWAHWFGYAYAINQANLLLGYATAEAADISSSANESRVRGLCVRAYSYMELMEEYCQPYTGEGKNKLGMSIYTTYDPGQAPVARATADVTWAFIISDLEEAAKRIGTTFTTDYSQLEDFDAGVVNYLLARAYILTGQWAKAVAACDVIIGSGKYSFIKNENYGCNPTAVAIKKDSKFLPQNNAFTALKKNPECILGYIKTSTYNPKTQANLACAQTRLQNPFGAYSSGGSTVRIDDRLYDKIAAGDIRKNAFYPADFTFDFSSSKDVLVPSHSAMKYGATHGLKDGGEAESDQSLVDENEFCKFRLSEVYLMKAEAQAQNNDADGAKATLNTLLAARSTGTALTCDTYPSMAGLSALDMVKLQYRIEMWGENGREYFNNKRWGINIDRTSSTLHWAKSLSTKASEMTLEIPSKELENNPDCVQD